MKRFWDKVDKTGECWEWVGARGSHGYGNFGDNGGTRRAHRVAYELEKGQIPSGLQVLHRCDNRGCVNPSHLFLGTHADNMADMVSKGRSRGPGMRGTEHPRAKLDEDDVENIRANAMNLTQRELGELFGVHQTQISLIIGRKTWAHLGQPKENS